jgi:hypothetical protein
MTATWDDERVARLVDKGGMEGLAMYGLLWRVREIVALRGQSCGIPINRWCEYLNLPKPQLIKALTALNHSGVAVVSFKETCICVSIPDLQGGDSDRLPWITWKVIRERIFTRDKFICRYCGEFAPDPECDHVIPLARGGSHDDENLATACQPCNRKKSAKLLQESAV